MDGTTAESDFTRDLNQGIGRGMGDHNEMVRHGPQANYSDYVANNKKDLRSSPYKKLATA